MAAKRNTGKDDDTAVSGISKHHRMRRKKSALAADAEVKAKNDWCQSIFASVLNAEQTKWQTSIYSHVLNAEETRESNVALKQSIEEMDEQARRIRDNAKKLEARAKKFANKADRFHKLRQEGSNDDEISVVTRREVDEDNISPETKPAAATTGGSSMKKMRDRRKKAALAKKKAVQS